MLSWSREEDPSTGLMHRTPGPVPRSPGPGPGPGPGSGPGPMSRSDILVGIITERLSSAARDILAVVQNTVADYEQEASGFRQEIERQRRQLEVLLPEVKMETADDLPLFPYGEAGVAGVPEAEEEPQKYQPSVVDSWSLGFFSYGEPVEDDLDEEEAESLRWTALTSFQDSLTELDFEVASRLSPSSVLSDRRRVGRPRLSDPPSLVDIRIRILNDSSIEVLSKSVFQRYPAHRLRCPRGLQEEDFLKLLRSTFPQLAAAESFSVFTSTRSRRLQPLSLKHLTPEEICRNVRSTGSPSIYIRLKDPVVLQVPQTHGPEPEPEPALEEDLQSSSDTDTPRLEAAEENSPGDSHVTLRIRVLGESGVGNISPGLFQRFPSHELRCPGGLQEEDFLDLLRSTFPQLLVNQPLMFLTGRGRKIRPLLLKTVTPEEILSKSGGNPLLYIQLKPPAGHQAKRRTSNQRRHRTTGPTRVQADSRNPEEPPPSESVPHVDLKIRVLEDSRIEFISPSVYHRYPVQELRCPGGLEEEDFLDLLRSTFPQLSQRCFDVLRTDGSRRLNHVSVTVLTPEEICTRTGNATIFLRLKDNPVLQASVRTCLDGPEEPPPGSPPDQTRRSSPVTHGQNWDVVPPRENREVVPPSENRVVVPSNSSTPQHEEVEKEEAGCLYQEPAPLWSLVLPENTSASDSHGDSKPEQRNGCLSDSEDSTAERQAKCLGVKKTLRPEQTEDAQPACRVCGLSRGSMNMLIKHAWNHVDEQGRLCGVCGRRAESSEELRVHLQTHQKTLGCSICGKSFLTAAGFKGHLARHSGNRPHKCKVCHKAFAEPSVLKNHEWVHRGEKPHECAVCHKSYMSKQNLKVHKLTHAGHKTFSCELCGKLYGTAEDLSRHVEVHAGTPAGRTKTKLQIHAKRHSAGQVRCSKCNKTFRAHANLRIHMRVHTGEKPYQCPVCQRAFSQRHCVKRHLLTHRLKDAPPINGSAH